MIQAVKTSLSLMSLRQRVIYFALVTSRAFSSLLDIAGIALIGVLTGLAASNLDPGKPLVILGLELPAVSEQTLIKLVLLVLLVFALKAGMAIALARIISIFLARIESSKAAEIARYLFSGNLSNLQRFNKGEITWSAMGSVTYAFSGLLTSLSTFISEGTLLILVAITFFLIDPIASVFVFAYFAGIIGIIQFAVGKALKKAGVDSAEGNTESMTILDDTIGAFREITIFNKQEFFIDKFTDARTKISNSTGTVSFLSGMPRYVVETALMLGVVLFVGFQFLTGQLATGLVTVGVFLTGGVRVMASLLPLQNALANVKIQVEMSALAQSVLSEAELEQTSTKSSYQETDSETSLLQIAHTPLSVEMNNLSFTYPGASSPAVTDISLKIEGGQHVAIIGPSGAGKTTLVDLILGLMEPTKGKLTVGGIGSNHHSLIEMGLVSYVPQRPGIVSGTIAENVALGTALNEIDENRVLLALSSAHLLEFVNSLPDGIFTSVGSQADSLSGGQIQRLGLARALYTNPKLIVLDEATSALDAGSEAFISESLSKLGKDVTVIVIAHRLSTVQHSDSVFVVDQGKVIASGSFSHLRKTVPMVAEYVKLMSFDEEATTAS
ncbi:ABC transporter ATP-binding protein [Aurantimicrobium minutum]|uniref:ABC transporter ATP-binding protein n=1 Tax=Aurantimicrobium minutum TaxID=708131 RepID=UPI0024748BC5|nr:ABC transporter ATP-binding protein [Aurantimicrobium minutum]MDH6256038.1 ABC-type multidrug transport system fused ATPase/permease subunit [Aurantimicrobium minutum]